MRHQPTVVQRMSAVLPGDCAISTVTSYELHTGVEKCASPNKERAKVDLLLQTVHQLPFDDSAARQSARIRAFLESQGQPIGPYDILLAGHALALSLILSLSGFPPAAKRQPTNETWHKQNRASVIAPAAQSPATYARTCSRLGAQTQGENRNPTDRVGGPVCVRRRAKCEGGGSAPCCFLGNIANPISRECHSCFRKGWAGGQGIGASASCFVRQSAWRGPIRRCSLLVPYPHECGSNRPPNCSVARGRAILPVSRSSDLGIGQRFRPSSQSRDSRARRFV